MFLLKIRNPGWVIAGVVATLILSTISFLIIALVNIKSPTPNLTQSNISLEPMGYLAEQVLTNNTGHRWGVVFSPEIDHPEIIALNLRLFS